jgi:mannosyltransferase OCH1-like enzyme
MVWPVETSQQLIPRVIHRLWLGRDSIPETFERYGETWRYHHPRWEVKLWTDDNLPPLSCQAEVDHAANFKSRYDMVRYEVLRQFGGVIIDLDMECLRPLDPLLGGVEAFVGLETGKKRRVGTQIIGAMARHPVLEHAVEQLRRTVGAGGTASQQAGPAFLTRVVDDFRDQITIFPRAAFLSPLTLEPPRRPDDFPNIYAVHHHAESWRGIGPEAEVARLRRRLAVAETEIHGLMQSLDKYREEGKSVAPPPQIHDDLHAVTNSRWWRLGERLGIVRTPKERSASSSPPPADRQLHQRVKST